MSETTGAGRNPQNDAAPAWNRSDATAGTRWGQPEQSRREHSTGRLRKTIEGLPDWEPLPPGEARVRRPGRDG